LLHDTLPGPIILRQLLRVLENFCPHRLDYGLDRGEKHSVHAGSGASPSLVFSWYGDTYPWVKRPGREADHSPLSSANVKIRWSWNSALSHAFMAFTRYISPLPYNTGGENFYQLLTNLLLCQTTLIFRTVYLYADGLCEILAAVQFCTVL
jgi:hypothetical protein